MLDDIINALETICPHYAKRDQEAKTYIEQAIKVIRIQKTTFCEIIDQLSKATSLPQFLTIMGLMDGGFVEGELLPVQSGMKYAKIQDRYFYELRPAIMFRYEEARRIANDHLDPTTNNVVNQQWQEHRASVATNNLNTLRNNPKKNTKILCTYFNNVLHPLICKIFKITGDQTARHPSVCKIFDMAEDQKAEWWRIYEDIPQNKEKAPELPELLTNLLNWKTLVETYLDSLSPEIQSRPDLEATTQQLFEKIDTLEPYLLRLQTAEEAKEACLGS